MEKTFAQTMARTGDAAYSATVAGYARPNQVGSVLAQREVVKEATRAETQRYLREDVGQIAVSILVSIGTDEKQPAGARVQAGKALAELSNIGLRDESSAKDPSEMDGNELHALIDKLNRQRDMLEHALAGKAIDVTPKPGVFE